ncbi:MAG: pyrroline-5-carboxylate reductase [Firmicutes bacterium]|nr:pyrroline-5-carboxylate reductase [Bacillota bacterium]
MIEKMKTAFLGSGFIAGAMISGLTESGTISGDQIMVVNPGNPVTAGAISEKYGAVLGEPEDLRDSDLVVFCVKPQNFTEAMEQYGRYFDDRKLYVSVMAGITTATLEKEIPGARVVRAMPNLGLSVGKSATGYALGQFATEEDGRLTEELFGPMGLTEKVDESLISAVTALSGSGPAYFYLLTEAMAEAAIRDGMDRDTAERLARQTFFGSARLMEMNGNSASEMIDHVASKGGTTEAGVKAMLEKGFKESVEEGYLAARRRSDALGK